jgi:hypothetical protein
MLRNRLKAGRTGKDSAADQVFCKHGSPGFILNLHEIDIFEMALSCWLLSKRG